LSVSQSGIAAHKDFTPEINCGLVLKDPSLKDPSSFFLSLQQDY